jgi:antitoxin StbD
MMAAFRFVDLRIWVVECILKYGFSCGELPMTRLATPQIATMTELREPQKVFDRADGKPVAILKNSALVGYLVPAEAMAKPEDHRPITQEELIAVLARTQAAAQPVLDYLKDK